MADSGPAQQTAAPEQNGLSSSAVKVVKDTTPVVAENALKITTRFYERMLGNNPELKSLFNEVHQADGTQPATLANSVCAYALNIDNLGALGPAVEKIAHRHVALNIQPEQYGTVHSNLMAAIGEVLGDAVTPEIGAGWSEAVTFLAGVCIAKEKELYEALEKRAGGWRGEHEFKLISKKEVAENTVAFTFAREDYDGPFEFAPGQYLTVRVPDQAPRHYTITSKPGDKVLQCTTRKLPGGKVSTYMHEKLNEGDKVLLGVPAGVFVANEPDAPKVLVSAGIGITPMRAFLQSYLPSVKAVLHIEKTEAAHAYKEEFLETGIPCTTFYTAEGGRPDLKAELDKIIKADGVGVDAEFYVCGPPVFMVAVGEALKELGVTKVYDEVFGTGVPETKAKCPFAK